MAPKGSKRASAAPAAAQKESSKRRKRADKQNSTEPRHGGSSKRLLYERHGGAAAVAAAAAAGARAVAMAGQIESDSASEGGESQTCTCGKCRDGWLSPAMADALGQVAYHARTDIEDALSYVAEEGLDEDKPLRRKHLLKVLSLAKVLRALPQNAQSRMTTQVLRVYEMLFQGIEDLLQAGKAADSDEVWSAWQEVVGKRVRQFGEYELPKLVHQHYKRQGELLTHLVLQARKYRRGEEVEDGRCANDDDYEGALQRMLGSLAPNRAALSESEGGSSEEDDSSGGGGSSDADGSSGDDSEYEEEEGYDDRDNWEDDYEQGGW